MSYDLSKNLNSNNSFAEREDFVDGYTFDSNNDRGAVLSTRVRNLSFSQIEGGTAVLGGTVNGNGRLIVNSSTGGTVVTLDNSGINISGTGDFKLADGADIRWGDGDTLISSIIGTPGTVLFDALDKNFRLETDSGSIRLYTDREVNITIGTGSILKVTKNVGGGTLMTLNGNTGDLRILGTIGTGIVF
mgnify:CR=1 FL=1